MDQHLLYTFLGMVNEMSPYLLLGFLVAGVLYAFVPASFYGRHLSGAGIPAVLKAALIGIPLPLCSCGVLPTAVSLRRNGASRAATTSFLIATPQTGVDSIAATWSLLGPAFAVIRPLAALITAFFGGMLASGADRSEACHDACETEEVDALNLPEGTTFGRRCVAALRYGFLDMVASIGRWLIAGLIIATLITVFVPDDFFIFFRRWPLLAMIAVVVVAIPMYVCSTGSIPIAMSLMLKGLSPGAAFVLLMAGPAANLASMIIVSRSLGRRAAGAYLFSIVAWAIAIGLAIDYLMPAAWFALPLAADASACCHESLELFPSLCSIVLGLLLVRGIFFAGHSHHHHHHDHDENSHHTSTPMHTYNIKGMSCSHCAAMVEKNLSKLPGVASVSVDLGAGTATVEGTATRDEVAAVVTDLGFTLVD